MSIIEPIATALNTSTYTAIQIPDSENMLDKFFPVSAYTSDGTEFYISNVETPAADKPVLENQTYNNNGATQGADGTVFYAKASAGTPNLVLHVGRPRSTTQVG